MREYWWILLPLLYLILLMVLIRQLGPRTASKIIFATDCVIILMLPTPLMRPPGNYVTAVLVVLTLWMLFRRTFNLEMSSKPSESNPSDG